MRANGRPTREDLDLVDAVRGLARPGGSALAAQVAADLGEPVQAVLRMAEGAVRRGVAHRYKIGRAHV